MSSLGSSFHQGRLPLFNLRVGSFGEMLWQNNQTQKQKHPLLALTSHGLSVGCYTHRPRSPKLCSVCVPGVTALQPGTWGRLVEGLGSGLRKHAPSTKVAIECCIQTALVGQSYQNLGTRSIPLIGEALSHFCLHVPNT